jgi:hypothetical protein
MLQQQHKLEPLKEATVQLALLALKRDLTLSLQRAAAIYNALFRTLQN